MDEPTTSQPGEPASEPPDRSNGGGWVRKTGRFVYLVLILPYIVVWNALRSIWATPSSRGALLAGAWLLAAGTVVFMLVERLSALDAFYFSFIALTTIGFGDITPQTELGKLLTVIYGLVGLGVIAAVIKTIATHHSRALPDAEMPISERGIGGR